jgi:nitrate/TMAO reductase-like tetraheme cytochrome c subunit
VDENRIEDEEPSPEPVSCAWIWWTIGVVLLVIAYAVPAAMTASPEACGRCHEMKPFYESWRVSSHRAAAPNCLYCHVKPGIANLVLYRFAFWGEIAASVTGADFKPLGSVKPDLGVCRRCHSLNREASTSGDLRIGHRIHVEKAGVACSRCHAGAVHKGVGGRRILPRMEICKSCHAAKMQDCLFCHTVPPIATSPSSHMTTGGAQ